MRRKRAARCFKSTSLFTSQTEIIQNINIFTSLQICNTFIQVAKLVQNPHTNYFSASLTDHFIFSFIS